MKKTLRIFTVLLVTFSMLVTISSCDSLKKDTAKSILGLYSNEENAEVIEFKKGDKVVLYTADEEIKGEYEYDEEDEEGTITLEDDDEEYDFTFDKDEIDIDGVGVYVLEDDKDFDIDEFIEDNTEATTAQTTEETTDETDEPTETNETDATGITLSGAEDKGWPKDDMPGIPDPDEIVTYFSSSSDGSFVMIEGMTEDEATNYINLLKNSSYSIDAYESTSSDGMYYYASDATTAWVYFWYYIDGTATISYSPPYES